jgi:hypothetical protein
MDLIWYLTGGKHDPSRIHPRWSQWRLLRPRSPLARHPAHKVDSKGAVIHDPEIYQASSASMIRLEDTHCIRMC